MPRAAMGRHRDYGFHGRVLRFVQRGINAPDADDLAERLTLRDREGDDRRMCVECVHLKANGRCAASPRRPTAWR